MFNKLEAVKQFREFGTEYHYEKFILSVASDSENPKQNLNVMVMSYENFSDEKKQSSDCRLVTAMQLPELLMTLQAIDNTTDAIKFIRNFPPF